MPSVFRMLALVPVLMGLHAASPAGTCAQPPSQDTDLTARRVARMERALTLGRARANAGQPSLALSHFEDALRAHPGSPEPYVELGRTLLALGRTTDAIAILTTGRRGAPDHMGLTATLTDALVASGRAREALALLREASRRRPRAWELAQRRAEVARELGAWSEAVDSYAGLLDIARDDPAVPEGVCDSARQMLRALAIVLDGSHPRARTCRALAASPGPTGARWSRALAACGVTP